MEEQTYQFEESLAMLTHMVQSYGLYLSCKGKKTGSYAS